MAPDGANVYAGTAFGLAVLGREVAPVLPQRRGQRSRRARPPLPVPCFDLNGDALAHSAVAGPAHGDLGDFDDAASTVRYRSEPGFVGSDFLIFRAHGGSLDSNTARVTINVTNVRPSVSRFRLTRKRFRRGRRLPRASRRAKVGTRSGSGCPSPRG